ncbi:MAG: hypothetical protein HOP30_11785 [Cyclobacteriaceae bacterium]|nr:hypothetical protein [Cyclobacteriaceae bacterium]
MQKLTKDLEWANNRPALSSLGVNEEGKLAYSSPPLKKILQHMVKGFPIMCWYLLFAMLVLFSRTMWAITHRSETVTHAADILIYGFLLFVSSSVTIGLIILSYFYAKHKLQSK